MTGNSFAIESQCVYVRGHQEGIAKTAPMRSKISKITPHEVRPLFCANFGYMAKMVNFPGNSAILLAIFGNLTLIIAYLSVKLIAH